MGGKGRVALRMWNVDELVIVWGWYKRRFFKGVKVESGVGSIGIVSRED